MEDELVIPKDFDVKIRIEQTEGEDIIIVENGLNLQFDLTIAAQNAAPDPVSRFAALAAHLTTRWHESLNGNTVSKGTALQVWKLVNDKAKTLKKNSAP